MSEVLDQLEIRRACQAGRARGNEIKAEMAFLTFEQRHKVELEVANDLITSEGLEHNWNQGVFYEVCDTPLCFLRQELGEGLTK